MKSVFGNALLIGAIGSLNGCAPSSELQSSIEPQKAASTSLCGDTYLQVFAPEHIAALSWQSHSEISLATEAQKSLPQIDGSPEQVFGQNNNLIVFGPGEGLALAPKLSNTVTLNWVENFEGVSENARAILNALDVENENLEIWAERLETVTKHGETLSETSSPSILYLTPSGGSAGPNTFVDGVIDVAGGSNVNPTQGWHSPNIETLIQYNPDIIIMSFTNTDYHSRSHIMTPVIERYLEGKTVITIKGGYWPCAGPYLLDAAEDVQAAIRSWQTSEGQDV